MIGHRGVLAALLTLVLAACDGTAGASAQPVALESDADATVAATASPAPTDSATPLPTPDPTPEPTPGATQPPVPPRPSGVTFTTDWVELPAPGGSDEVTSQVTHTVRWKAPRTDDVEVRVYGVTQCLSEPSNPSPGTSGPCLVEHTRLPSSVMALAATAPAAAGEISWIAPFNHECGPPVGPDGLDYQAVVIAAYNAAGHSVFAIAEPGNWWRAGPDEVVC